MVKFLKDYICLFFCLIILEYVSYSKDYNEVKIMGKYINFDIKNTQLDSFDNGRYTIEISERENGEVEYQVILHRDSLFSINKLKTIKYNGLVN